MEGVFEDVSEPRHDRARGRAGRVSLLYGGMTISGTPESRQRDDLAAAHNPHSASSRLTNFLRLSHVKPLEHTLLEVAIPQEVDPKTVIRTWPLLGHLKSVLLDAIGVGVHSVNSARGGWRYNWRPPAHLRELAHRALGRDERAQTQRSAEPLRSRAELNLAIETCLKDQRILLRQLDPDQPELGRPWAFHRRLRLCGRPGGRPGRSCDCSG